jgi:hypothetical protein
MPGDKWMTAAQFGLSWKFAEDAQWKLRWRTTTSIACKGQLSAPCALYTGINYCSTDYEAPDYMQWGNTVFLLRDIVPNPSSPDNYAQPQFVGLAYNYHVADLTNKVDFKIGETPMEIQAEYERNMAYHSSEAFDRYPDGLGVPVNNYQGGSTAGEPTVLTRAVRWAGWCAASSAIPTPWLQRMEHRARLQVLAA